MGRACSALDHAQIKGGIGQYQDQPAEGHRLHPGAQERNGLPDVKQPEIPVAQGGKGIELSGWHEERWL